jgi:hypothetical protein
MIFKVQSSFKVRTNFCDFFYAKNSVSLLSEWHALTNDVFVLPRFLLLEDQPRFLLYLVQSRKVDVVLLSNSELGYFSLPLITRFVFA